MVAPSSPSFIPKQPASGKIKKRNIRKVYVLAYVSFVFFFGTLIAAGATFFYENSAESQLEQEKQRLVEQKQKFDQAAFERVKELDTQLDSAENLLNQHVSLLSIIYSLEAATLATVQLEAFKAERTPDKQIKLTIDARTKDFNSVLFQRQLFQSNTILSKASLYSFSIDTVTEAEDLPQAVTLDPVTFTIEAMYDPSDIGYVPRQLQTNEPVVVDTGTGPEADSETSEVVEEESTFNTVDDTVTTETI